MMVNIVITEVVFTGAPKSISLSDGRNALYVSVKIFMGTEYTNFSQLKLFGYII